MNPIKSFYNIIHGQSYLATSFWFTYPILMNLSGTHNGWLLKFLQHNFKYVLVMDVTIWHNGRSCIISSSKLFVASWSSIHSFFVVKFVQPSCIHRLIDYIKTTLGGGIVHSCHKIRFSTISLITWWLFHTIEQQKTWNK
jgi:hypothetical protein